MIKFILSASLMHGVAAYSGSFQEVFTNVAKTKLQSFQAELIEMSKSKPQPVLSVLPKQQFDPSKTVIRVTREEKS